ncbi:MAG: STAS domain-containing protein [Gammaproteobacteria bacterium]|nr:STAS domain-containing protein [Gammaproteobacteria bacterium]
MKESYTLNFDSNSKMFHLSGELTFATANKLLEQAPNLFESHHQLKIDLTKVTRSDSAGLALLINWMRWAKKMSKEIRFYNVPAQILAIAHASGVDELLPIGA